MKAKVLLCAQVLLILTLLTMFTACEPAPKPITSLQIFGLDTEVFVSSELGSAAEEQQHYFLYYFVPEGDKTYFRISRVTQADYESSNIQNPLEANVGQFGLWAISQTLHYPNSITGATFNLRAQSRCGTNAVANDAVTLGTCNASAQVASLNCTAQLKLYEILSQQHNALQAGDAGCGNLQIWNRRGMANLDQTQISHVFTLRTHISSTPQYDDFPTVVMHFKPVYHPGLR
jgi:hypothetical protein